VIRLRVQAIGPTPRAHGRGHRGRPEWRSWEGLASAACWSARCVLYLVGAVNRDDHYAFMHIVRCFGRSPVGGQS